MTSVKIDLVIQVKIIRVLLALEVCSLSVTNGGMLTSVFDPGMRVSLPERVKLPIIEFFARCLPHFLKLRTGVLKVIIIAKFI